MGEEDRQNMAIKIEEQEQRIAELEEGKAKVPVLGQYNHIHRTENDQVDSLEFGPAKCRQKIYYNARNPEDGKKKVDNAIAVMEYAMAQVREKGLEDAKKGGA